MNSGFSIGKIPGITINIDWSWILIFLLIVWNLAAILGPLTSLVLGAGLIWIAGGPTSYRGRLQEIQFKPCASSTWRPLHCCGWGRSTCYLAFAT
jgi:hypothetical protein